MVYKVYISYIRLILFMSYILSSFSMKAQAVVLDEYYDAPTQTYLMIERLSLNNLNYITGQIGDEFTTFSVMSTVDQQMSNITDMTIPDEDIIDFSVYEDICDCYETEAYYEKCRNKYNFLKECYDDVFAMIERTRTLHGMSRGTNDLIQEKYVSICNLIVRGIYELEEAENEQFAKRRLGIRF